MKQRTPAERAADRSRKRKARKYAQQKVYLPPPLRIAIECAKLRAKRERDPTGYWQHLDEATRLEVDPGYSSFEGAEHDLSNDRRQGRVAPVRQPPDPTLMMDEGA